MLRFLFPILVAVVFAFASEETCSAQGCQGCACELFIDDVGSDPCWSVSYTCASASGTCVWDGPTCDTGDPCSFQMTWHVAPRSGAPSSCSPNGLFAYTYAVDSVATHAGNTAPNRSNQCSADLRCDTDWLLEVENDAGGALVGAIAIVCHPCGIVIPPG